MSNMERRRLLRLAAGGVVGGSLLGSGRAQSTETDSSSSVTESVPESDEFDPVIHGFGFPNWGGETGTGADGEEFVYEPGDVDREDVRDAIDDSWTTALSEVKKRLMTRIVYSWIGGNAATNGHCYGMSFVADQYFQDPSELPDSVDSASEIPRPTGRYDDVGDRIRRLQTSQLLRAEPYWYALLGLRWGLANHQESLEQLTSTIDATGTAGLALDGESNPHQVLARGYEREEDVTNVFVYDPTYAAAEHDRDIWTLSVDRESGDVLEIEDGYDEFLYHDPEMDVSTVDRLIGGRDRVLDELSNAVFLGLETGGVLDIDVPDEVRIDRPDAEYADPAKAPFDDAVLVLEPPEEFEVSIDGEAGSEYSLDTLGLRDGDLALEESLSDTLEDASSTLHFTVDEAGEFVVDVAEAVEEEAGEAAEEAAESAEEVAGEAEEEAAEATEESDGPAEWVEDNWWLPAAGGLLGLGVAYRYLIGRSDERDGE